MQSFRTPRNGEEAVKVVTLLIRAAAPEFDSIVENWLTFVVDTCGIVVVVFEEERLSTAFSLAFGCAVFPTRALPLLPKNATKLFRGGWPTLSSVEV